MSALDELAASRARRRAMSAALIMLAVLGGALLAIGNAHLVYVAITSEPACTPHKTVGDGAPGAMPFAAAAPSC